jgi:hypothetical protein
MFRYGHPNKRVTLGIFPFAGIKKPRRRRGFFCGSESAQFLAQI